MQRAHQGGLDSLKSGELEALDDIGETYASVPTDFRVHGVFQQVFTKL